MPSLSARLAHARAAYLRRPSRAALRGYLILKARSGRFDARMCAYYGVPAHGLTAWVKRLIVRGYAAGLVPTATTNGVHAPGSFHTSGRAVDLGLPVSLIGTRKGLARLQSFQRAEFALWTRGLTGATELIGPVNDLVVLRGMHAPLLEGTALENQHDNHFHGAHA
jgi:hypothetical protein